MRNLTGVFIRKSKYLTDLVKFDNLIDEFNITNSEDLLDFNTIEIGDFIEEKIKSMKDSIAGSLK